LQIIYRIVASSLISDDLFGSQLISASCVVVTEYQTFSCEITVGFSPPVICNQPWPSC